MKEDIKIFLIATLIYTVFASLATALFWVLVKANIFPFVALLYIAWFLFILFRKPKTSSAERLQRLRSLWIQGLISEEELQLLSGEKSKQYREFSASGIRQWGSILGFYSRNILKNNEKRLQTLDAYRVKEKILDKDYQAIRKTILRNL